MCHSGPLSYFTNLFHFFKKNYSFSPILHCPYGFQQFLFTHNFYSQFLPTIFSQISTDLYRSSQFYLAIPPLFLITIFYLAPSLQDLHKSSQILHSSFKDLSKFSFLHPFSLGTWTVGHSGPLSSFPQIFTDLHRFILPFSLYLCIIYSIFRLQDLHRSSTDLSKIFQKFPFLHPPSLGTWTVGHSGPLSRSPSLPSLLLSLRFITGLLQIFQNFYSSYIPCFLVS